MRRQRRLADPLIDIALFAAPAFSAALATNALSFFVMFGVFLFTAQYMQLVIGLSPLLGGTVDRTVIAGLHGRLHADAGVAAPRSPGVS